ncbi:unnamed protein product, partial [Ixodes pacificus]
EQHGIAYKSIVGEVASVDVERAEQWLADNLDEIYSYTVAASLTEDGQTLDDFINADEDVVVSESSSNIVAMVREVWPTLRTLRCPTTRVTTKTTAAMGLLPHLWSRQ